ncbi:hypothetical protein C2S53_002721 [Perilla frutescens var. hirtella]|uniref:Transmembrane protein n=1 Tax=Perilla frutescens var. hirtella TaxID=608512 RepID=A0AAD4JMW2_PERFH|nr:hypothetical protein C2S53_002721 [Perilla frutescens var. hirtella]
MISVMRMKCAVSVITLILVSSHFPFPTTAIESISKSSVGIRVSSLQLQATEIFDSKSLQASPVRSRKMKMVHVLKKKRLRTIPATTGGGGRSRTKSWADRDKASLLHVCFVIVFSIFFAFFSF